MQMNYCSFPCIWNINTNNIDTAESLKGRTIRKVMGEWGVKYKKNIRGRENLIKEDA